MTSRQRCADKVRRMRRLGRLHRESGSRFCRLGGIARSDEGVGNQVHRGFVGVDSPTGSRTRVGSQSTAGPRSAFSAGAVQVARPSQSAGVPTGDCHQTTNRAQNTRSPAESLPTINGAGSTTTCHRRTCLTADWRVAELPPSICEAGSVRQPGARCKLDITQ